MTDTKISDMTAAGALTGTEIVPLLQSAANKRTTASAIAALSGITALTGDVTASGVGSQAATLATVNSNVGSFTHASLTVNAKGLITAASNGSVPTGKSSGFMGSAGTVSSSSFATKGDLIIPLVDFKVYGLFALLNEVNTAVYQMSIFHLTAGNVIDAVTAQSATQTAGATATQQTRYFTFASPPTLTAGSRYAWCLTRTDSTTTYVLPIYNALSGDTTSLPIQMLGSFVRLASVGPVLTDTMAVGTPGFSIGAIYEIT
jgi:hypothetical protein